MANVVNASTYLKTGEEYKESLRDGRVIWYRGEQIEDVTTHPATAGGINWLAELYDEQHKPESRDLMSYVRSDDARVTRAWQVPRTREDLAIRRQYIEHTSRMTLGMFGRQMDNIAMTAIGMAAYHHWFKASSERYAENIFPYFKYAEENNIMVAGLIADPQGARTKQKWSLGGRVETTLQDVADDVKLPPVLRVVKQDHKGVWISGAKVVGTVLPQAQEMFIITQPFVEPEESIWCALPCNAPGIELVLRQSLTGRTGGVHPITNRGEETDCLVLFDNVFVPHERIFSLGDSTISERYGLVGAGEHWNTVIRMTVKAELFAGLGQLIVDTLGTGKIARVRELVEGLIEYASVMRAFVIASEQLAKETESGVMWPDVNMITAARLYGVQNYSRMLETLRELAGQGPLMLYSNEDFDHPRLGPKISQFLEGFNMNARAKNILMGLVWDIAADGYGMRQELFERLNGYPIFFLKERLYNEYDRTSAMKTILRFLGIDEVEARS